MQRHNLQEFLSRSTEKEFSETDLGKVLPQLPFLSPTGPWLAGGAIRNTLLGKPLTSDLDFFFKDEEQLKGFEVKLQVTGLKKKRETEHHLHYQGKVGEDTHDIQLIRFMYYSSAAEVIDSFDFTICQLAYDGTDIILGDYTLWDLARKRLAVHKITYPVASMRRVLKYAQQGFRACNGCLSTLLKATIEDPNLLQAMDVKYVD